MGLKSVLNNASAPLEVRLPCGLQIFVYYKVSTFVFSQRHRFSLLFTSSVFTEHVVE